MYSNNFYRFFCALIFSVSAISSAQEVEIMVRAQAGDAKFIGSSIGGAKILIKDALTNEILAEGITKGSTGNTEKIMKQAQIRGKRITDDQTAGFNAKVQIAEPRFVTIEAYAPWNKKQARVKSSTQLWLLPGKDITGEGIILKIPGFVVDIVTPQTHQSYSSSEIKFQANIVMMCGCPITKGGLWDANQYEVNAILKSENMDTETVKMEQEGGSSNFVGKANLEKGSYELIIQAFDPVTGNTGVDRTNFMVN